MGVNPPAGSETGAPGCRDIAAWIDDLLSVDEIEDYPGVLNGLQVEGARPVRLVGAAVDACLASIEAAADAGCDMLLVHHGLFWGGPQRVTGPAYRRLKALFDADLALYSVHLPLDIHPELGNNSLAARVLGLGNCEPFGSFGSVEGIGLAGLAGVPVSEMAARVAEAFGGNPTVILGGPDPIGRMGVVTGGGGSLIRQAAESGLDALLTGEGNHHTYHEAAELGLTVFYAGHYATETAGIRALAARVAARFGGEHIFLDHPTGL